MVRRLTRTRCALKRAFDIVVGSVALIVFSPLMALIALLVRLDVGRPVFFTQIRPGRHGLPFLMYKFRTMREANGPDGRPLPDFARLTRIGTFLRAASLDELPELVNVLRGEMSLVGPRPLLPDYLPLYSPDQRRRHDMRPGMTGWAQVNGRNSLSWEERFALDIWYVDNWSFWLDVQILVLTVVRVLRPEGVSEPGEATMSRFKGSDSL